MRERHKAAVVLTTQELARLLELPEDVEITHVQTRHDTDLIYMQVQSPRLPNLPEGAEAPRYSIKYSNKYWCPATKTLEDALTTKKK